MAEKKKITKRVISKVATTLAPRREIVEVEKEIEIEKVERVDRADRADTEERGVRTKRGCFFCLSKTIPTYTDLVTLRKFLTERAKIVPKLRSSVCSKHQRIVTKQIKYARHLALFPFVPKV